MSVDVWREAGAGNCRSNVEVESIREPGMGEEA